MRKWIAAVVVAASLAVVGCQKDDMNHKDHKPMVGDACPMCPGVQKATADGKCEKCGMAVSMKDACGHCPGVQTVKADGTCSGCGAKM